MLHSDKARGLGATRGPTVLVLLALVGATAGGLWLANVRHWHSAAGVGLLVKEEDLDFGTVELQDGFKWTLRISNVTDEDMAINGFDESCNCTVVKPKSLVIPAGQTRDVQLVVDLSPPVGNRSLFVWPFSTQIVPRIARARPGIVAWELRGKVFSGWVCLPPSVNLGDALEFGASHPLQTVRVVCRVPMAKLEADCDERSVKVRTARLDSLHYRLEIIPDKRLPAGAHDFEVRLKGLSSEGETVRGLSVPVRGRVLGVVEVFPTSLVFGPRRVGDTVTEVVVLQTRNNADFSVIEASSESTDVEVQPAAMAGWDGRRRACRLWQRITKSGHQSSNVRFVVKVAGIEVPVETTVNLSYYGVTREDSDDNRNLPAEAVPSRETPCGES
jgi:hypothetical protein